MGFRLQSADHRFRTRVSRHRHGYVYSLDAKTGCVYWSFQTKAAVRGALSVGPVMARARRSMASFFGDFRTYVYGLDAQTGQQIWSTRADDHFIARITALRSSMMARLYVPVSIFGRISGGEPGLPVLHVAGQRGRVRCQHTASGSGKPMSWMSPSRFEKEFQGRAALRPAGGSVWNSPTIDTKLNAIYFGTGDGETDLQRKPAMPYGAGSENRQGTVALPDPGKRRFHGRLRRRINKSDNCPICWSGSGYRQFSDPEDAAGWQANPARRQPRTAACSRWIRIRKAHSCG